MSFENLKEFWLPFRNGRVKSIKCSVEIVCPQTYFILTGYILLRAAAMTWSQVRKRTLLLQHCIWWESEEGKGENSVCSENAKCRKLLSAELLGCINHCNSAGISRSLLIYISWASGLFFILHKCNCSGCMKAWVLIEVILMGSSLESIKVSNRYHLP